MVGILAAREKVQGLDLANRDMVKKVGEQLVVSHDLGDLMHKGAGKLSRILIFDVQVDDSDLPILESFLDGSNTNYIVAAAVDDKCLVSVDGLRIGNAFADRVKLMKLKTLNLKRTDWRKYLVQDLIELASTYGGADIKLANQVKVAVDTSIDLEAPELDLSIHMGNIPIEERKKEKNSKGGQARQRIRTAEGVSDELFDEREFEKDFELDLEETAPNSPQSLKKLEDGLFDEYDTIDLDLGLEEEIVSRQTPPVRKPKKPVKIEPEINVQTQQGYTKPVGIKASAAQTAQQPSSESAPSGKVVKDIYNINIEGSESSGVYQEVSQEPDESDFEVLPEVGERETNINIRVNSGISSKAYQEPQILDGDPAQDDYLDDLEREEISVTPLATDITEQDDLVEDVSDFAEPSEVVGKEVHKISQKDNKKVSNIQLYVYDSTAEYYEHDGYILKYTSDGKLRRIGKAVFEKGSPLMYLEGGDVLELYKAHFDKNGDFIPQSELENQEVEVEQSSVTGSGKPARVSAVEPEDALEDDFDTPLEPEESYDDPSDGFDGDSRAIAAPIKVERPTLKSRKVLNAPTSVKSSRQLESEVRVKNPVSRKAQIFDVDDVDGVDGSVEIPDKGVKRGLGFKKDTGEINTALSSKIKPPKVNQNSLLKHLDGISKGGYTILVTGSRGAGVTTIAYELALTLARIGYNTAFFDMDMRSRTTSLLYPDVAQDLHEMGAKNPIMQALHDPRHLSDVALHTLENLDLFVAPVTIPIKELHSNPENLRSVETVIAKASNQYTFTIVDCPIELVKMWGQMSYSSVDKFLWVAEYSFKGVMDLAITDKEFGRGVLIEASELILNRYDPKINIAGKRGLTAFEDTLFDFTSSYLLLNDYEVKIIGQIPYDLVMQSGLGTDSKYTDTPNGDKFLKAILANL